MDVMRLSLLVAVCVLLQVDLAQADVEVPLEVGLAAREITPDVGYGHYRGQSTGVSDPLQAKAVVFRQGETKGALIICDLLGVPRALAVRVRATVADATDIPFEHIGVAATHTHTGPSFHSDLQEYVEAEEAGELTAEQREGYIARLIEQTAGAAIDAYEALGPMALETVRAEEHGVSFNRRFLMRSGQVRFNPGIGNPEIVRPVGPIDPEVLTVLFRDADGRAQGGLINFANHTDTTGGTAYSGDYPHYLQQSLREHFGEAFLSIFGLGTAGDLNHLDVTAQDRLTSEQIGDALGEAIRAELDDAAPQRPNLAVVSRTLYLPLQGYTEQELAWAEDFDGSEPLYRERERPFIQQRRARKIRSLRDIRQRKAIAPAASGEPWTLPIEIQVIRLSEETAVVTMPGEVFVELGLDLKERSPFRHTLPIELANASIAYVPTERGFREGDYEAINSRLAPGAGEAMVDAAVEMLEQLAAAMDAED